MIYISGRISGNKHWKEQFKKAEDYLVYHGYETHEIINPLVLEDIVLEKNKNASYADFMKTYIRMLMTCNEIFMLQGWRRSKGAKLEHHIAVTLGIKIIYQKRGDF